MLKLYAHPYSANSRKIHWALEELGVPYEYVQVDLIQRAQKQPSFIALNPHGRVPVIDDGGFTLYESNAILLYLVERHGQGTLAPKDAQEAALIQQWLFVQAFDLQPSMQKAFVLKLYASLGQPFEAEAHQRALSELPPGLAVLEAHLAGRQFVLSERFTAADIALAEPIGQAQVAECDLSPYPNIRSWFGRLAERPGFQKTRPKG